MMIGVCPLSPVCDLTGFLSASVQCACALSWVEIRKFRPFRRSSFNQNIFVK